MLSHMSAEAPRGISRTACLIALARQVQKPHTSFFSAAHVLIPFFPHTSHSHHVSRTCPTRCLPHMCQPTFPRTCANPCFRHMCQPMFRTGSFQPRQAQPLGAYKLARLALRKLAQYQLPDLWREEVELATILIRARTCTDDEESYSTSCFRCQTLNPLLPRGGDAHGARAGAQCVACGHAPIRCFGSFDILPLVRFTPSDEMSTEEAYVFTPFFLECHPIFSKHQLVLSSQFQPNEELHIADFTTRHLRMCDANHLIRNHDTLGAPVGARVSRRPSR